MSVTAAAGFRAAGIDAGIKEKAAPDLALVVNDGPEQVAAGVFTTNQVKAAPDYDDKVITDEEWYREVGAYYADHRIA